jgi:hypothetical protein
MTNIINFKLFNEAWLNRIKGGKGQQRDPIVSTDKTFEEPTHFIKNAQKLGNVGNLELHSSETHGGGMTHFTWSPEDKKIHHILYAASSIKDETGNIQLKYLSAHGRKTSPVRMSHVYKALITDHDRTLVGTSHSPGAKKLWDRMKDDPDIDVKGIKNGRTVDIDANTKTHVMYGDKDKETGNMHLIARKVKKGEGT